MKKNFVSILITNYNKSNYLEKTINSCLIQDFKDKEVLVFDDCSSDNSLKILKKFKDIRVIKNKIKKSKFAPLNQIHGLCQLFKISKGNIIFLLDSDDVFKKNKINEINRIFQRDKKIDFIQDTPYETFYKKKKLLKKKIIFFLFGQVFIQPVVLHLKEIFLLIF
jgi:glycosyltransferase involved in cell wall biosynthesis